MHDTTFIGLDVHTATISVAVPHKVSVAVRSATGGTVAHRPDHIQKLGEKLCAGGSRLHFCHEAGPCGYGLHRQIVELGHPKPLRLMKIIPFKTRRSSTRGLRRDLGKNGSGRAICASLGQ